MKYVDITQKDQELIETATAIIKKNFLRGKHHVGSAVRAKSGKIYAGIHLDSQNVDVCAENVAMGMAVSNGERKFDSIVAIQMRDVPRPTIILPCKTCQELINFYETETWVIVEVDGQPKKCRAKELLTFA
ncbi:MAG: cytidine deaminase [Patescibacteria group bacterium]|nr:cytidine deaminase [Patescibacteria group bacterium]MDD4611062.1 cytidine deaminase [Patescibacteria group bacterium]